MTDICRHYAKGNCWRGSSCGFIHPREMRKHQHIKQTPPTPTPTPTPAHLSVDEKFRTRGYIKLGCLEFRATRKCAQGKECHYIHEPFQSIGGFSTLIKEYERENKLP